MSAPGAITIDYAPWPKARPFHDAAEDPDVDIAALVTGAGFGKTVALTVEIILQVIEHGYPAKGPDPPYTAILIAPTHQMLRDVLIPMWMQYWPDELTVKWR